MNANYAIRNAIRAVEIRRAGHRAELFAGGDEIRMIYTCCIVWTRAVCHNGENLAIVDNSGSRVTGGGVDIMPD